MGGKLGTIFARAGHEVVFSYARSKGKLTRLARAAGANARAGTPDEAVRDAGFDPVDAGPLRMARYTEPLALLVAHLAYDSSAGPELAYRFERYRASKGAPSATR
jgi:predicted dinucleotide-binding enzyme